jgi:hypothetical protein
MTGLVARDSEFTMSSVCALNCQCVPGPTPSALACFQPATDASEIVWRIDADRVVFRFDDLDADTVLQRAQLLERFDCSTRSKNATLEQALPPIDISCRHAGAARLAWRA